MIAGSSAGPRQRKAHTGSFLVASPGAGPQQPVRLVVQTVKPAQTRPDGRGEKKSLSTEGHPGQNRAARRA